MSSIRAAICALFLALFLASCATTPPDGIHPVTSFEIDRYLGRWYEIARLDHSFERGMSDVNATYLLQDDGSVKVINRGYDTQRQAWKEAIGRALFIGDSHTASLKVSFFGPFLTQIPHKTKEPMALKLSLNGLASGKMELPKMNNTNANMARPMFSFEKNS
jgi:lipocalin